jgi:hypothetical protein
MAATAKTSRLSRNPSLSPEDCLKYRGKWVAISMSDGRVLASDESELEVAKQVDALGLSVREYVLDIIPDCDTLIY